MSKLDEMGPRHADEVVDRQILDELEAIRAHLARENPSADMADATR